MDAALPGRVVDGPGYSLPETWATADPALLERALRLVRAALEAEKARDREGTGVLRPYFDPTSDNLGAFFSSMDRPAAAGPVLTAADLLAVDLLGVDLTPSQVRPLLEPGPKRSEVKGALAAIPRDVSLRDLVTGRRDAAPVLARAYDLHAALRDNPAPDSHQWVFASKVCARKLPHLMPVRDSVVCTFLNGGDDLVEGGIGTFAVDLQVFAYVVSHPGVHRDLQALLSSLRQAFGTTMDGVSPLRVLDVVVYQAGLASIAPRRAPSPADATGD